MFFLTRHPFNSLLDGKLNKNINEFANYNNNSFLYNSLHSVTIISSQNIKNNC